MEETSSYKKRLTPKHLCCKLACLKERNTTVSTELTAGLTTFVTMAYLLAVNPSILTLAGGVMRADALFTATALSVIIATLASAFFINLPLALGPSMALNAFFVYTAVFSMGFSPQIGLTAVLLEGLLLALFSLFNLHKTLLKLIPDNLKKALVVGIGLFLTLLGLKTGGLVVANPDTLLALGNLKNPSVLGCLIGITLMFIFYVGGIKGSILLAILLTTLLGLPLGYTFIPSGFTPFSLPSAPLFLPFDFSQIFNLNFIILILTLFCIDIFGLLGALIGILTPSGLVKNGQIPHLKTTLLTNAGGTMVASSLGITNLTPLLESTAGVVAGGRTGLTSLTVALLFGVALFLSPLFLLIPSSATAPALIFIGFLMTQNLTEIDFKNPYQGIPAFLTIVLMPLTHSIFNGIIAGLVGYALLSVVKKLKNTLQKFNDVVY